MKDNRGRLQAQGSKLEESEPWAQDEGLRLHEGLKLLNNLKLKIPRKDLLIRNSAFIKAENKMNEANKNGGINVDGDKVYKKSFSAKGKERVDIEVLKGSAFV